MLRAMTLDGHTAYVTDHWPALPAGKGVMAVAVLGAVNDWAAYMAPIATLRDGAVIDNEAWEGVALYVYRHGFKLSEDVARAWFSACRSELVSRRYRP